MALDFDKYKAKLTIDELGLEDECKTHASIYNEVADELAIAISIRDELKNELAETKAEADARARHDLEVEGEKVTVSAVDARVKLDKDVIKAQDKLARADLYAGRLGALKDSFNQRKSMLGNLVELYVHNYYGDSAARARPEPMLDEGAAKAREAYAKRRAGRRRDAIE